MTTIILTKEQIELLGRGEILTLELGNIMSTITIKKEPKKWEPQGGRFYVRGDGTVGEGKSFEDYRNFSVEAQTKELANKKAEIMRRSNRLLDYILEHAPEHDPEGPGSFPYRNGPESYEAWYLSQTTTYGTGYTMPEEVCGELCKRLNNGEVEL